MDHNFLDEITGSFAMPAADNPTVAMVEAVYRHHQLPWRYINCEVTPANLANAVKGARGMNWAGFNCSIPHKVAVIEHLDGLGASAEIMGAVNCVVRRNGAYIGENTDGKGFLLSLRQLTDPAGKSVVILGAGGAARAISVELALAGASDITIVNRDATRGQTVVDLLNARTKTIATFVQWSERFAIPAAAQIVINATSVGLFPNVDAELNLDPETLQLGMIIADVIPNPPRTRLIRDAEARGCLALDGLGMVVNQGVIGIKYWTGIDVDAGVMRNKLAELFGV
ncbi:MAG: Shikimate/quinate 5-dehydrogenase [Devosia sp.]|nr:Shikimate/quinate 5-dehydrogenase [Devosia sp.]